MAESLQGPPCGCIAACTHVPTHTLLHMCSCTHAPAVDAGHVLSVVCGVAANRLERDFGGRVLLLSE